MQVMKQPDAIPRRGPVPREQEPCADCAARHRFFERLRRVIDHDCGLLEEYGFVEREMQLITGQLVSREPSFRRLSCLFKPMTGDNDMIPVLFQRHEEVPRFGIRLVAIAVLVLMDRIDRGHELLFRAVLLPEVKGRPLLDWRDRAVDLFQLQVKDIAELPERVVYVYDGILGHGASSLGTFSIRRCRRFRRKTEYRNLLHLTTDGH